MSDPLNPLLDHVQQMIQMRTSIEQLKSRKSELMNEVNGISLELLAAEKQFKEHKKVLDHCLLTGDDPVQVRLTMNTKELRSEPADRTNVMYELDNLFKDKYDHIIANSSIFKKGVT